MRFITEGVNILFKSAKQAYLLGIHTPSVLRRFFNLPHGVCGIQMELPNVVSRAIYDLGRKIYSFILKAFVLGLMLFMGGLWLYVKYAI